MTTLIQQKSDNDCVLASIAMLAGKERWEDLWTPGDLESVIKSRGVSEHGEWLARAGYKEYTDYKEIYCSHIATNYLYAFLWRRRALLSVHSLNNENGSHMVFWDGVKLYDPQDGVEGKLAFRWLTSCVITRVWIFKDQVNP